MNRFSKALIRCSDDALIIGYKWAVQYVDSIKIELLNFASEPALTLIS